MIEEIKKEIMFYLDFKDVYNNASTLKEYLSLFQDIEENLVKELINKKYNLQIIKRNGYINVKNKKKAISIPDNLIKWKQIAKLSKQMHDNNHTN